MHGVTQIYTFLDFLKLNKFKLKIDSRNTDIIVIDVCLCSCPQLILCRCRFKLVAQIYRANLCISKCSGRINRLFRQRYNHLCVLVVPERVDSGINISIILFLLNACQVLPVADRNTAVRASVRIEPANIAIVRPFTVPMINNGSGYSAHQSTNGCRLNDCKCAGAFAHI